MEQRRKKGRILDEFTQVTGYHRKAAVRLLRRGKSPWSVKRRGRPRRYSPEVTEALKVTWEATDRLCSKRLQPSLPELVDILRRHGEITMTAEVEAQLCRMSPATIDRLLHPWRRLGGRRPFTTTKLGSLLKRSIPIRTFADWQEDRPGSVEVDLVHHCGEITEGFYLTTLSTVDVASGWSECIGVWGQGQQRVGAAVHLMRPFPLLGLDSDNDGELAEVSVRTKYRTPQGGESVTRTDLSEQNYISGRAWLRSMFKMRLTLFALWDTI